MRKLFKRLNSLNMIPLIFAAFFIKTIIFGSELSDALIAISLCGIFAFKIYLDNNRKPDITGLLSKEVSEMKQHLAMMKMNGVIRKTEEKTKRYF